MLQDNARNQIGETGCHEGNYSMTSMLAGARLEEARGLRRSAAAARMPDLISCGRLPLHRIVDRDPLNEPVGADPREAFDEVEIVARAAEIS